MVKWGGKRPRNTLEWKNGGENFHVIQLREVRAGLALRGYLSASRKAISDTFKKQNTPPCATFEKGNYGIKRRQHINFLHAAF